MGFLITKIWQILKHFSRALRFKLSANLLFLKSELNLSKNKQILKIFLILDDLKLMTDALLYMEDLKCNVIL